MREFAASVLIGGPPPAPTTPAQRDAARKQRYRVYAEVLKHKGRKASLADVCRDASSPPGTPNGVTVRRTGRGSLAQWWNGTLEDSAVTCQRIEAVLDFRPLPATPHK